MEGLELALEQWPVKACVVVPNHSNPMGATMSDLRKQQMVRMLEAVGEPINVTRADSPGMVAMIHGPTGQVELR